MLGIRSARAALVIGGLLVDLGSPAAQTPQSPQTPPSSQTPQGPQAPQGQTVFRGTASLVPVDVRVIDRNGKSVTDLTQADFSVFEDGARQQIRHFSAEALTAEAVNPGTGSGLRSPTTADRPPTPAGDLSSQRYRVFLIVLGRGRLQPPAKGVDGMLHFVRERLLPQDRVAVLAWNRATQFTTDHEKVAELLERFKRLHEGVESKLKMRFSGLAAVYGSREMPPGIQSDINAVFGGPSAARTISPALVPDAARIEDDTRRTQDLLQGTASLDAIGAAQVEQLGMTFDEFVAANTQTMQDLNNLYMGVEYLRHIDGEKHMVFVAESGLLLPRVEDDKNLASVASDARVVIDYVHTGGTGGVNTITSGFSAETRGPGPGPVVRPNFNQMNAFSTARTLATLTGGSFYGNQFPKVADDMDRLDESARFQYLIGYYPSRPNFDGRYRRIDVRVNRPGLTVLFRHGYYARAEVAPFNRRSLLTYSRMLGAAGYNQEVHDIKVSARASMPPASGPTREVSIEATIDPSRVVFEKANGRNTASVEVAVACLDGSDHTVGELWQTVELNFTDDRLQHYIQAGVSYTAKVHTAAPPKRVKVIVYDYGSDLVGSAIAKVQ